MSMSVECRHGFEVDLCGDCARPSAQSTVHRPRSRKPSLSGAQRQRILKLVVEYARDQPSTVQDEVRRRVERRLSVLDYDWPDLRYRKVREGFSGGEPLVIEADSEELIILHALAGTGDARQYGVTPRGEVYPSQNHGYLRESDGRLYVQGISPLIEELGAVFTAFRSNEGGRFYLEGRLVRDASSRRVVARIVIERTKDA
jgi:hypothetical protein